MRELEHIGNYIAALAGAGLYGLYTIVPLIREHKQVTVQDVIGIVINILCAILCGLILTYIFALRGASMIPWASFRDPEIISFAMGAFGWELLPLMFPKALRWASERADRVAGRENS